MTQFMKLDASDKAVLVALDDDFNFSDDGESATITGNMTLTVMRSAPELFELRFKLPSGEPLDVKFLRVQLLDQFDIKTGDSAP